MALKAKRQGCRLEAPATCPKPSVVRLERLSVLSIGITLPNTPVPVYNTTSMWYDLDALNNRRIIPSHPLTGRISPPRSHALNDIVSF